MSVYAIKEGITDPMEVTAVWKGRLKRMRRGKCKVFTDTPCTLIDVNNSLDANAISLSGSKQMLLHRAGTISLDQIIAYILFQAMNHQLNHVSARQRR